MKTLVRSLLFLTLVLGCKKEKLPEPKPADPVFLFSGDFEGTPVNRQAGNDGYFMFSSHTQQESGLYTYQGDLKKDNCVNNCDYALTVKFNDSKLSAKGEAMEPDRALYRGPYLLNDLTKMPSVQKIGIVPGRMSESQHSYTWTIVGPTAIPTATTYSIAPDLKLGATYTVDFSFNDNSGFCQTRLTNVYHVGNDFQSEILAALTNTNTYKFTPKTSVDGQYTYKWEFGDGTVKYEKEPEHTFPATLQDTTWLVKLTVTKGQAESITYCQVGLCHANFSFQPQPLDLTKLFKTITFELRDPSGNLYSSADVIQPASSFATVLEITDYDRNGNNDYTKKIKLSFECVMKGPDGEKTFKNGNAVIAVSYK